MNGLELYSIWRFFAVAGIIVCLIGMTFVGIPLLKGLRENRSKPYEGKA